MFAGKKKVAKRLKKCLYDSEYRKIYDNYFTFDQIEFNNQNENSTLLPVHPTEGKLDDMVLESDDENISTDDDIEDNDEEHSDPENDANNEEILRISKFVLGKICNLYLVTPVPDVLH